MPIIFVLSDGSNWYEKDRRAVMVTSNGRVIINFHLQNTRARYIQLLPVDCTDDVLVLYEVHVFATTECNST